MWCQAPTLNVVRGSLQHLVEKDSEAVSRLSLEYRDCSLRSVMGISVERAGIFPLYLLPLR